MKLVIFINTPAQAHTWKYLIKELTSRGHSVKILARDYGGTPVLLNKFGLEYILYINPDRYRNLNFLQVVPHVLNSYKLSKKFKVDLILGFGVIEALVSILKRKKCIIFTDSEPMPTQNLMIKMLASTVITPDCFKKSNNFGRKHVCIPGYKELAYLHPNYFQPDPTILAELDMGKNDKYVILRFNAFDAVHDIGRHGFDLSDKYRLVEELKKHARVFISSELALPPDLEKYNLPTSPERIHHALYYAQLLITDTQTMTTEAAILGTPAIRCNNFVGPDDMGNFIELEQKYDLIYSFNNPEQAIIRASELIQRADLKQEWVKKRKRLLNDKIDVTEFIVKFIENYPESYQEIRKNQSTVRNSGEFVCKEKK